MTTTASDLDTVDEHRTIGTHDRMLQWRHVRQKIEDEQVHTVEGDLQEAEGSKMAACVASNLENELEKVLVFCNVPTRNTQV